MPAVAPVPGEAVPWVPPPPAPETLGAEALRDEGAIVRYLETHPERLGVESMATPDIAKVMAQVLLRADRTFLAERLLAQATEKWKEDNDLRRAHGRVLLSLGRADAARALLAQVAVAEPEDASTRYLLGRAWLAAEPRTPETDAQALAAFERTLALDPEYRDPDGVTAAMIHDLIRRVRKP
ncbi:MAG: hypothetical protein H6706_23745 [Myxococcales bacterium]|nr:hypothetical protein [Myxococcales bacterium]